MRTKLLALAAVGLIATAAMTACDGSGDSDDAGDGGTGTGGSGKAMVGVIMPDTKSSTRWSTDDPKYLKATFDKNGVPVEIQNAQGDKENFKRIGKEMIANGAKVLIIANLDSISGKAVIDEAHSKSVPVIDYDRLTLNGGADYYVSFDGELVGQQQAYGLRNCLTKLKDANPVIAELNGSPTDNNATLFKGGYDGILQPFFDDSTYTKGPDQWVPDWDNEEGAKIFTQMITQQPKIGGVLAANDGLGNAVIEVLRKKGLNGKVPVTGQDATVQGLQNILSGDQCMTVYKPFEPLATAAANAATDLFKGKKPPVKDQIKDPESGGYVPFVKQAPRSITIDNVSDLVTEGYVSKKQLCTGKYAKLCSQHGIK
jgi:D-xylose transport system substrate-binding protein